MVFLGKEKQCLTHPNYVTCSRFHPVNPHLTITGSINCLFCWDIRCSKQPTKQYRHKDSFGQVKLYSLVSTMFSFLMYAYKYVKKPSNLNCFRRRGVNCFS